MEYLLRRISSALKFTFRESNIGRLLGTMNMNKVVIKILHGSVVTQTVLDGLNICPPVANFP